MYLVKKNLDSWILSPEIYWISQGWDPLSSFNRYPNYPHSSGPQTTPWETISTQGKKTPIHSAALFHIWDSPKPVSSITTHTWMAVILWLARAHFKSLPAEEGAHPQSPMQNQHLSTTCDSRICLALWPSGHEHTQWVVLGLPNKLPR